MVNAALNNLNWLSWMHGLS
jgi:hypothetical protein